MAKDLWDQILRAFGTNRVRLRWQWQRFKESLGRGKRSAENRSRSFTYEHQLCPICGQPAAKDATACVKCGTKLQGVAVQRAGKVLHLFLPEGVPIATTAFLAACVALFFITVKATFAMSDDASGFSPSNAALLRYGSNHPYWTLLVGGPDVVPEGTYVITWHGWWRLVTANFLHGGVMHILMNALSIWSLGSFLEHSFGRARTFVMLIVTGMAGHLLAAWWPLFRHEPPPWAPVVGASTAAFGQIGMLLGHALKQRGRGGRELRERAIQMILYGLLFTIVFPNISITGHVGGLVAGFVLGLAMADVNTARKRVPDAVWNVVALATVAVVVVAFVMAARFHLPPEVVS
jgi:rhomboid protease GluP